MTALKMAAIIAESALATLRQLAGVDPRELQEAARAIGNNAAMILSSLTEEMILSSLTEET